MKKKVNNSNLFFVLLLGIVLGCGGIVKKSPKKTGSLVKNAYYLWVYEVEESHGNTDKVINLYADNTILLPTLSPQICTNKTMLIKYFLTFLSLEDTNITTERLITKTYGNIAMNTGLYTFSFIKNGKKKILNCRFDFWYKKIDGEWKIVFHQSSVLPMEQ